MADDKKTDDYTIEMGKFDHPGKNFEPPPSPPMRSSPSAGALSSNPVLPVLAYCGSSIMMTVMNKYVLSGSFNLNFFLLCVQVCVCLSKSGACARVLTGVSKKVRRVRRHHPGMQDGGFDHLSRLQLGRSQEM